MHFCNENASFYIIKMYTMSIFDLDVDNSYHINLGKFEYNVSSIEIDASFVYFLSVKDSYSISFDENTWSVQYNSYLELLNNVNLSIKPYYLRVKIDISIDRNLYNFNTDIYKDKKVYIFGININGIKIDSNTLKIQHLGRSIVMDYDKTANILQVHRHTDSIRELQETLTLGISDTSGFVVTYFKVSPIKSSYVFKQHTLYNVERSSETVQIVFPLGEFQRLKSRYVEWGVEFSDELKVQLSVTRFKQSFNDNAIRPTVQDIIYMPFFDRLFIVTNVENDTLESKNMFVYTLTLTSYFKDAKINTTDSGLDDLYKDIDNFDIYEDIYNDDALGITNEEVEIEEVKRSDNFTLSFDKNVYANKGNTGYGVMKKYQTMQKISDYNSFLFDMYMSINFNEKVCYTANKTLKNGEREAYKNFSINFIYIHKQSIEIKAGTFYAKNETNDIIVLDTFNNKVTINGKNVVKKYTFAPFEVDNIYHVSINSTSNSNIFNINILNLSTNLQILNETINNIVIESISEIVFDKVFNYTNLLVYNKPMNISKISLLRTNKNVSLDLLSIDKSQKIRLLCIDTNEVDYYAYNSISFM